MPGGGSLVYFNQLLGAANTLKLVEILFGALNSFLMFFSNFSMKLKKNTKMFKKMCFKLLLFSDFFS